MSRTTLDLQDQLLRDAKAMAAQEGTTLTRFIEDGMRMKLERHRQKPARAIPDLPTFEGGGLRADIDMSSNAAILDVMDDGDEKP